MIMKEYMQKYVRLKPYIKLTFEQTIVVVLHTTFFVMQSKELQSVYNNDNDNPAFIEKPIIKITDNNECKMD